jgi:precorrin-4/cobalt-precorrin-4 C11-methyltransferase
MLGKVFFIGAGPGDPELITIKGRRLLDAADVIIYAGSLINPKLLESVRAELYDSSEMTLDEIIEIIGSEAKRGKNVARLHSGDPTIYGAIKEQMVRLDELGISYEVVPGVSSATAVAAALKTELTLPEVSQTVIITRLRGRTPALEKERLSLLAAHRATLLIFLSVSMIEDVVKELLCVYSETAPIAVVEKASWPQERIIRGSLNDIAQKVKDAGIKKTAIIVVGDILLTGQLKAVSKLYDPHFEHGYRKHD